MGPVLSLLEELDGAEQFLPTIPGVITTEMPEIEQLASWQSAYLGLLGDEGLVLAGFYDPFSYQFAYGQDGAQPYRLGWFSYNNFVLMSRPPTTIGGNFQDLEWNAWVRYARQLQRPLVFTWTGWMNGKFWSGPTGINLPPGEAQFVSDFQLASNYDSVWNWQLGFAPQLDGTFNDHINSNALMVSASRAVLSLIAAVDVRHGHGILERRFRSFDSLWWSALDSGRPLGNFALCFRSPGRAITLAESVEPTPGCMLPASTIWMRTRLISRGPALARGVK